MTQTPHDSSERKPTEANRSMQYVEPGELVGAWSRAQAARKMGEAFGVVQAVEPPQEQLPFIDDHLRLLTKAFNGEINGGANMTKEVVFEQALYIMKELGTDLATHRRYVQALYATLEKISQPGTQFVTFDNDTSMTVFESPADARLPLKIDTTSSASDLMVVLPDGKRHSVLSLAEGDNIRSRYKSLIEQARVSAQDQMINMPKGSAGPAEAVIGYARLGIDLLLAPPSLDLGESVLDLAKDAQKRLQRYGIQIAEVMRAAGGQKDPVALDAFVAVMVELQRLDSNKDAILDMLKVLDTSRDGTTIANTKNSLEERMSGLNDSLARARGLLRAEPDSAQA